MGQFSVEEPVAPGSVLSGNQQSVLELCTSKSLSVSVLPLGTGMPIRRAV